MKPEVDLYLEKAKKWQPELKQLRNLCLDCGLTEGFKWGCPCYMLNGSNIVLIHDFKEYCALLFFKGALLNNASGILVQQTKNVQAARQIRFTGINEISEQEATIKACIMEAIEIEKAGLKVSFKKSTDFDIADEFKQKLDKDASLRVAFESLTPGRQKGYLLYFSSAKQAKTRELRIDKSIPQILKGKGLDD